MQTKTDAPNAGIHHINNLAIVLSSIIVGLLLFIAHFGTEANKAEQTSATQSKELTESKTGTAPKMTTPSLGRK